MAIPGVYVYSSRTGDVNIRTGSVTQASSGSKHSMSVTWPVEVLGSELGLVKPNALVSDGTSFFLILLKVITVFSPLRIFLPVSAAAFMLGAGYAVWTALTQQHITNSSVLLILLSVVIFLVGLVSEQISMLRSEGPR